MSLFSFRRDQHDVAIRLGPFWLQIDHDDEAVMGLDVGPFHSQASVDLGESLECPHGGAVAWGKHYPAPGRDVRKATNGSAPGYQKAAR